eukprot:TRINITY_DN7343_c0_g1_i1.p1 TRINITY_DN7343_c0_g1~~TRINITY_DN7343_c0_g1_i1.p1  ORF type:complete len:347 (+),score=45.17 TRINITY_DN7343_c0_g1_i1:164-1204(+)
MTDVISDARCKRPADDTDGGANCKLPKTTGLEKKVKAETAIVKVDGKKLRAGTIPWRYASVDSVVPLADMPLQVLLIEGINSPGSWSFPAGSLDPGEDIMTCAVRETEEESGSLGSLGCFLGTFESEKSRSYFFLMNVHTVLNEGCEFWNDPDSTYMGDGKRRRKWFSPDQARSFLKKGGPCILDAFLGVPYRHRADLRWRPGSSQLLVAKPRLLLLGGAPAIWEHCCCTCQVLAASSSFQEATSRTDAQHFAMTAAAVWEADVVICAGGIELAFVVALASSIGRPTLLLLTCRADVPTLMRGDSRVTIEVLCIEDESTVARDACRLIDSFLSKHTGSKTQSDQNI